MRPAVVGIRLDDRVGHDNRPDDTRKMPDQAGHIIDVFEHTAEYRDIMGGKIRKGTIQVADDRSRAPVDDV